ncbi:MAG: hypothetical protein CM15mP120_28330 [Pseudomonadota bacterium]|nr:MAG: hypothetical protein CM15mP120_28330 [Pseudomonadota bacterium]
MVCCGFYRDVGQSDLRHRRAKRFGYANSMVPKRHMLVALIPWAWLLEEQRAGVALAALSTMFCRCPHQGTSRSNWFGISWLIAETPLHQPKTGPRPAMASALRSQGVWLLRIWPSMQKSLSFKVKGANPIGGLSQEAVQKGIIGRGYSFSEPGPGLKRGWSGNPGALPGGFGGG